MSATGGIVVIGKRKYAVGLYWENSPTERVAHAARDAASQPGHSFDFFAIRPGTKEGRVPQFGLALRNMGHTAGMPSFAACLAGQQGGSWAGAFRLREGFAVTVVRDDLLGPDGDVLYLDEIEARDRLLQEMSFGGLQKIYAPEAWAVPGSDSMPISLLLADRKDIVLRAVTASKKMIALVASAILALALVVSVGWYFQDKWEREEQDRLAKEEALRRAQEEANKLLPSILKKDIAVYPPPKRTWEENPLPIDFLRACSQALHKMPISLVGWTMGGVVCKDKQLTAKWTRSAGRTNFPEDVAALNGVDPGFDAINLEGIEPRGAEELLNLHDVIRRAYLQNWDNVLRDAADDPLPAKPVGFNGEWNPPPAPWIKRSFTFVETNLPGAVSLSIGDMTGVVITQATYGGGRVGGQWTIEGVVYANKY